MPVQYDAEVIRPGMNHKWTKEMAIELMRCATSIEYFALNHCKVLHPTEGVIPMEFREYQVKMMKMFSKHNKSCSLLSRQTGKCLNFNMLVRIRNKKTNEIKEIRIGDFFKMVENS